MKRLFFALTAVLSLTAFAQEDAAPAAEKTKLKLSVLPFALLSSDVPQRAGPKAQGMLLQEFKSADGFTLLDAKKNNAADAFADMFAAARKSVDEAKELRSKKKFRLASEALTKAIASYTAAAGGITDIAEVVDTYALLAAVQFNTGRDEEGTKNLRNAITMAPDRDLPLAATSALFGRLVNDTRKSIKEAPRGGLIVESTPSNAPVLIDGLSLGATPLTVTDMPAGLHFWRTQLPNGELLGGTVEVVAGKQMKITATSSDKAPEARVLASVAQNRIDIDALAALKEHAKTADAEVVVFGGLSHEGKGLSLDSFAFSAKTGEVRRLSRTKFDDELLSAGMEFFNLAGELSKKGIAAGDSVKVPATVSISLVANTKMGEAKYGVVPGKEAFDVSDDGGKEAPKDGPRKPVGPRVPLKKK